MKLKLAGVAFGALMVGLVGAGEAKADAIGFASLVFNTAFFSNAGSTTPLDISGSITFNNLADTLTNSATFNGVGAPSIVGSRTAADPTTTVDPAMVAIGSYSGGQNNFGFTTTNTNFTRSDSLLTGSLTTGNAASSTVSETQVLNGNNGTSDTRSKDASLEVFTASSNLNLQFNVGGALALYASTYASTNQSQTADASIAFSITLVDQTTGTTILSYSPSELNTSVSSLTTPGSQGSTSPSSFFLSSGSFTLTAGDTYKLTINQETNTDATAVPEPGTLALFGAGLAGIGFLGFRRQKKSGGFAA
jgi:hypothetical protein